MSEDSPTACSIQTRPPLGFGLEEVVIANVLGLLPALALGPLLGLGLVGVGAAIVYSVRFGTMSWWMLIALSSLVVGVTLFNFTPYLGFANYYIKWLVSSQQRAETGSGHICQLTTVPRLNTGFRGFLEDADDIGVLQVQDGVITFTGDHIDVAITGSSGISVSLRNIGARGFWFIGRRVRIELHNHPAFQAINIVERQSRTIRESRALGLRIFEAIDEALRSSRDSPRISASENE